LFLGGSAGSFTGLLLVLIAKADPGDRRRLRQAFPREVAAWELWTNNPPMTSAEMAYYLRSDAAVTDS
jgi:hypothetical protein